MKKFQLGEFEELVLLTVGILYQEAYGLAIKSEMEERLKRGVSVGALQAALRRLETKGFLKSSEEQGNQERAGRPKRFYQLTAHGKDALAYTKTTRENLWQAIPDVVWNLKTAL
jgi:DNA-binding PadR family transcriptional regulator